MKNKYVVLAIIAIVLLGLASFTWMYEARLFVSKASSSQAAYSVDNSYVFISPLRAQSNNKEKIRLTVYLLNNQGLGVLGKRVTLGANPQLTINEIQPLTDNLGKAVFDVSSRLGGDYYIDVIVENTALPQKAHLSFF